MRFATPSGRDTLSAEKINASDSTFILVDATREDRVPPGTGTAEAAKKAASRSYSSAAAASSSAEVHMVRYGCICLLLIVAAVFSGAEQAFTLFCAARFHRLHCQDD